MTEKPKSQKLVWFIVLLILYSGGNKRRDENREQIISYTGEKVWWKGQCEEML